MPARTSYGSAAQPRCAALAAVTAASRSAVDATPTAPIGSPAALSSTVSVSPPTGARKPPSTKILPSQAARSSSSCIGPSLSSTARVDNVCHTVATRVPACQTQAPMASLADISRHAGTSVATASRVLNGSSHPVSDATRARVTRSSRISGVIVNDIVDPYFAEIARGVEDVAGRSGHLVMVCNADHRIEAEIEYVRALRDYHAEGVVFAGSGAATERPANEQLKTH